MARWITVRSGKYPLKAVKDGPRIFLTPDHFIDWHDEYGWRKKDQRFINRWFRWTSRQARRYK